MQFVILQTLASLQFCCATGRTGRRWCRCVDRGMVVIVPSRPDLHKIRSRSCSPFVQVDSASVEVGLTKVDIYKESGEELNDMINRSARIIKNAGGVFFAAGCLGVVLGIVGCVGSYNESKNLLISVKDHFILVSTFSSRDQSVAVRRTADYRRGPPDCRRQRLLSNTSPVSRDGRTGNSDLRQKLQLFPGADVWSAAVSHANDAANGKSRGSVDCYGQHSPGMGKKKLCLGNRYPGEETDLCVAWMLRRDRRLSRFPTEQRCE